MKAAIYTRVSTLEQTTEHQLEPLRRFCESQGFEVVLEETEQLSGRNPKRPGMLRIYKEARARRVQVVVVAKLDRWGRNAAHCVESIQGMRERGCRFMAIDQGIDIVPDGDGMKAATSDLYLRIMGAMAQFEAEIGSERTKAGIQAAVKEGRIGQPTKPCHDCGAERPKGKDAVWGKRLGRRVPLCVPCKGSRKGVKMTNEKMSENGGAQETGVSRPTQGQATVQQSAVNVSRSGVGSALAGSDQDENARGVDA